MAYFTKSYISFFRELKDNNERPWFQENKKRYEKEVLDPFYHFVDELIGRIHDRRPDIVLEPKEAIFRIYRDIRFSKDKTPYKTHMSAYIARGGRKNMRDPGLYIQFGGDDARIYSGLYMIEKNDLLSLRRHIASHPGEFARLINDQSFRSMFGEIRGEKNKILPAEFREAVKNQPLLANKSFYFFASYDPEILLREDLPEFVMTHYNTARPLNSFLAEALDNPVI